MNNISKRAKALGTGRDTIIVSVGYKGIFKEVERTYIEGGFFGVFFGITPSVKTKKYNTLDGIQHYLTTSGIFPSINHIEELKNEDLPLKGSVKENAGKYLEKYFDYLEGLFKEKA